MSTIAQDWRLHQTDGSPFVRVGTMLTAHRLSRYELAGVDGKSPAFLVRDPAVPVDIRDVHPRGGSDWLP